ncbi:hypothetical protein BV20DRAFT_903975, partial [Pilatotrama ljubarskyi]
KRNVAFGVNTHPAPSTNSPEWDQFESISRARGRMEPSATATAAIRQHQLRPRRSMAPALSGFVAHTSAQPGEVRDPREHTKELAYTGPGYGPRDNQEVQRILTLIDEMVGEEATSSPPAYLKVAKMSLPKAYKGKDDGNAFEIWLYSVLEFCHTLRITSPSLDRDRIRILGECLSEEASSWFYNTVQSPLREKHEWLFEEAVIGLFRRFIHRDNHLIAAQQFERLKFDAAKGGVAALYERLLYISERMWEKPTRFQMRAKFIEALPESYEHVLTVVNGLSVKYNSLSELYQAALDIEQNTK